MKKNKCEKCDSTNATHCEFHIYGNTPQGTWEPMFDKSPLLCPKHMKEHNEKEHSGGGAWA